VIVPVRNCEAHLADQLAALANQTYSGDWELVVVDNACTDRSIEVAESFRERVSSLRIVAASHRGVGLARNAGARTARGGLLAYCDADDVAAPDWLATLIEAALDADIVGGVLEFAALNSGLQQAWESAEPMTKLDDSGYGFLTYASAGNCAVWKDVALTIGWDETLRCGGSDIDFGWRAQLGGYDLHFAPQAAMHVRFRATPTSVAKRAFRNAISEPYLFRRFRGHGMPANDLASALAQWRWLARKAPHHLRSFERRGTWLRIAGKHAGRLVGSIRWRTLYL
jgi:glycosyltransferase involved in cell wall biosynthesis